MAEALLQERAELALVRIAVEPVAVVVLVSNIISMPQTFQPELLLLLVDLVDLAGLERPVLVEGPVLVEEIPLSELGFWQVGEEQVREVL